MPSFPKKGPLLFLFSSIFVWFYFVINCSCLVVHFFCGFLRFEFSQCDIWYMRFCLDYEQRVRIPEVCIPKLIISGTAVFK